MELEGTDSEYLLTLFQGCLVANLIGLLQLLTEYHYRNLWEQMKERKPKKDFLLRIFLVFRNLIQQDVYPGDWLVMRMTMNSVVLSSLQEISVLLIDEFLDDKYKFDGQVSGNFIHVMENFFEI